MVLWRGLKLSWVCWLWGLPGGAVQDQPLPVVCPGEILSDMQVVATCTGLGRCLGESRLQSEPGCP